VPELTEPALAAAAIAGGWSDLRVVAETGSTNADLLADATAPVGTVLIALRQTAGRGRLDRQWVAVPGGALTFSVLLAPAVPPSRWGWLPLLTGLAAQRALADQEVPAELKWPNDLLLAGGKVGGILVQRSDRDALPIAVVGIGLNVRAAPDGVAGASAVADVIAEPDPGELLLGALAHLRSLLDAWEATGGDAESSGIASAYRKSCATLGRPVVAHRPGAAPLTGTAYGIDELGRIVLRRSADDLAATADGDPLDCAAREVAIGAGDVLHLR
jgi:BirA family transcriptional regulator, biotin operon repressor / biotin---[acetyl-CoA-carboxylase] ligase